MRLVNYMLPWCLLTALPAYAAAPLADSYCQWLHTKALAACATTKSVDAACTNSAALLPGNIANGVLSMSLHEGFGEAGFKQACQNACNQAPPPDFASFKAGVCSGAAGVVQPATPKPTPTPVASTPKPTPIPASTTPTPVTTTPTPPPVATTPTPTPTTTPTPTPSVGKVTVQSIANYPVNLIKGCELLLNNDVQFLECMNGNLKGEKKRLNIAYKAQFDTRNPDLQTELEQTQKTWLNERDTTCGKITPELPPAQSIPMTACIYKAVVKRADELAAMPVAKTPPTKPAGTGKWYKAAAKPFLTVRDQPAVNGTKLGTVPEGEKVKVLQSNVKSDFISGRSGFWVKVEWTNGTTGYVFDAFLAPL